MLNLPAFADDLTTPTLDKLHQSGTQMPESAEIYPESAYTLKEVAQPGTNTITKYEKTEITKYYDPETGAEVPESALKPDVEYKEVQTVQTTPKYYEISLKNANYGHPTDYDDVKTFNITTPNADNTGNEFEFEVNYYVNNDRLAPDGIRTNQNGADINMDFFGLKNDPSFSYDYGGAIYNSNGKIGNITGDFISNHAQSEDGSVRGGAIYNFSSSSEIGNITGDFIGNYALSESDSANGGAIYNQNAKIGDITGDFIGNYAQSESDSAFGGAIYNSFDTIGDITGNFIGNYAQGDSAGGGAIYNRSTIGNITGDFIGNYAQSNEDYARGGAISNSGTIGDITGDFIVNYAQGNDYASGGGIYNSGSGIIGDITGNFIGNYAQGMETAYGGAIYNDDSSTIGNITGDFIGNYAQGNTSAKGGAIYNYDYSTIGNITGNFIGNYVKTESTWAAGGAFYNNAQLAVIIDMDKLEYTSANIQDSFFINNYAASAVNSALGGAIFNICLIGVFDVTGEIIYGAIKNSSFIGNYAKSETGTALGGAIFSMSHLNITADNGQSVFSGNKTISNGIEEQNAIALYGIYITEEVSEVTGGRIPAGFMDILTGQTTTIDKNPASLTLKATNNGVIVFDDTIRGGGFDYAKLELEGALETIETPETAFDLTLTGDNSGKIYLNNSIINANITLDTTNVYVSDANNLSQSKSLAVNSGTLNITQFNNQTLNYSTFSNSGIININSVDVDLANKSMGRITADNYGNTSGSINVQNLNLLSDATQQSTQILFADKELANNVQYTGQSTVAYSPIYKYNVNYDPENGLFTFLRGSGTSYDSVNPAVVAPSVAAQTGAYTTQLQTFNYAFQHSDNFMNLPFSDRLSIINSKKYAIDTTTFSPLLTGYTHNSFWVKPYASFESVPLKNGPDVSNINYGTLIGYDSDMKTVKYGWNRVITGYVGYNGASQRYQGVNAYQNGGLVGSTITLYKGNFFNATTISAGASTGSATSRYGSENYVMLLAGIANKSGYNLEFNKGRLILQPNFLISYSFVNTFDYMNASGLKIESDPLNIIQLSPGIKLIGNTKSGWQPYLSVNMVWNLMNESKITANTVRLPEMSMDPYVSYGAGVQKSFKDDTITAFGQAMIHNGGRNGISLTAGFRWKVGKDK